MKVTHLLPTEQELLSRIANGDQFAFKVIYDRYRPFVYRFSLKYLKSREQAEEIVQEIFLKLWRLGPQLLQINNLENYIQTMSRNRSMDYLRRMKMEAVHQDFFSHHTDDYCNDTEEAILLKDTKKVLQDGIELLPPQQKLVYTLCHIEGRRQDEVAAALKLSPETVKRHAKLALKFLRSYVSSHTDITAMLIILKLI